MEQDQYLFDSFEQGNLGPTLRIYGWEKPCITLGYSQDPNLELNSSNCSKFGIEIVKRPTGGGIVFHNEHEVTYSFVCDYSDERLPKGLVESYKFLSEIVIKALKSVGVMAEMSTTRPHEQAPHNEIAGQARICFSYPASYEIMLGSTKIVGSAQKRGKRALLQQGSIFVRNTLKPSDFIRNCVEFKSIYDITGQEVDQMALSKAIIDEFLVVFSG
jgi:lipoate-protein ligase A